MKQILFTTLYCISLSCYCQTSSNKIYQGQEYKKGLYKTYEEFIINNPSFTPDFIIKEKNNNRSGEDTYGYKVNDKTEIGKVWGFCDGKTIYVHGLRLEGYHKLEYVGFYSFFSFIQPGYSLATAALPDHLVIINQEGKYEDGTAGFLEKLLAKHDMNLLDEFKKDPTRKKIQTRIKYLIKLNEILIK